MRVVAAAAAVIRRGMMFSAIVRWMLIGFVGDGMESVGMHGDEALIGAKGWYVVC